MSVVPAPRRVAHLAFLADGAVLVVFVLVGRRSHDEGSDLESFVRVLWPFAAGLVIAWLAFGLLTHPFEWRRVVLAWVATVAIGMVVRVAVQGRDFKVSFVIVTTLFVGAGMLGWRWVARWVLRWVPRRLTRGRAR